MKTVKFEIDTDALERSITSLQEETEGLKRDLESLTASMEALNQTWEGAAKEAYMEQYRNDRQNMETLCRTLEEFIRLLEYAKKEYQNSDSKVKTVISRIEI